MDEYALHTPVRQTRDGSIIIVSGRPEHFEGIAALDSAAYAFGEAAADDPYTSEMIAQQFLKSLEIFPEGQFVAIDTLTGAVVGKTQSMRYHYDPSHPMTDDWAHSTGDG